MLFQVNAYIDYGFLKVPRYTNAADLVRDGFYAFVDADGARTMLETAAAAGVDEVHFFGMLPGEDVDPASRRLQYIDREVVAPALD